MTAGAAAALLLTVAAGAGCSPGGSGAPPPAPPAAEASVPPASAPLVSAPRVPGQGQPRLPTVAATVGGDRVEVEVATTARQQAAGLRDRAVPPGTGMAFPYPGGRAVRFTMSGVELPLVAVFARGGRVLAVERLAPCAGTVAQCPTYGPAEPVDLVVEVAPGTLPAARAGDPVSLGPGPAP